jgi:hypothetical protein
MNTIAKVADHPGLVKDLANGGVINVDEQRYKEHLKVKAIANNSVKEKKAMSYSIEHINGEINNLKQDVDDIKQMLQLLIDRK